jgi:hypothetical protein
MPDRARDASSKTSSSVDEDMETELAISHSWALLKEEKQIIYKGTTHKGKSRKGSFNDDMHIEGMLFCPFFNGK